eukprot:1123862-Pyramimonas_sp.AAC.1
MNWRAKNVRRAKAGAQFSENFARRPSEKVISFTSSGVGGGCAAPNSRRAFLRGGRQEQLWAGKISMALFLT